MKTKHRRQAYYLDDGFLIRGYTDKYGFHPYRRSDCGFSTQKFRKKDIGKTIFYENNLPSNHAPIISIDIPF